MDIVDGLCWRSRELLYQLAAQFRGYLVDGRDIASLENLLNRPSSAFGKAQEVIDLLRRRGCIGVAVLPVLIWLVLMLRSLLELLVVRLRIVILLLHWLRLGRWLDLWRSLNRRGIVQFGFDGFTHEIKDSVDFLLKLLRIETIWQFDFDLAVVLLR